MPRQKEQPKALFQVKHDFYASLDNVAQQGVMLLQCLETMLQSAAGKIPAEDILRERVKAFRAALTADD